MDDEYWNNFKQAINKSNQLNQSCNILVVGKAGVGKSTLINTVFKGDLLKTGNGSSMTDRILVYYRKPRGSGVEIHDTPGFSLDEDKQSYILSYINHLKKKILSRAYSSNMVLHK